MPHHLVSVDDPAIPAEMAGRAMLVRRLEMLPVECVARGYLTGSGLADVPARPARSAASRCRPGWTTGSRLPEPIFTPTTKAPVGEHDENDDLPEVRGGAVGPERAGELRELTLARLPAGRGIAAEPRHHRWPTPSSSSAWTPRAR